MPWWMRLVLVCVLLPACAPSLQASYQRGVAERRGITPARLGVAPSARCQRLSDRRGIELVVAEGFGVLAIGGVAPVVLLNDADVQRDKNTRLGVEIGMGVSTAIAAAATVKAAYTAGQWAQEGCGAP
jgi:hypothetical protein